MAKASEKMPKKKRGPFLAAAFFCESVLESKDGSLTPVRMLDQLTIVLDASAPPDVPSDEKRLPINVWSVVGIKSGDSPGDHALRIVAESPSGKKETVFEQTITLSEPAQGGINFKLHQTIAVKKGGLFWMHVFLDGSKLTSMPLLINVVRQEATSEEPAVQSDRNGAKKRRNRRKP